MSTHLSSADVERVLFRLALIAPSGEVAFRARLKHLQRLGIPLGANTGKGKRVPHSLDTLFQLVVAVELMQVGIPPAMVARTIEWNWTTIRRALLLCVAPPNLVKMNKTYWQDGALFLVQSPHALEGLMTIKACEPGAWHDDVQIVHQTELGDAITAGDRERIGPGRSIVLNLLWLAGQALHALGANKPAYAIVDAWIEWRALSEQYGGREIYLNGDTEETHVDPEA